MVCASPSLRYPHIAGFDSGVYFTSEDTNTLCWAKLQRELVPERSRVRLCPVPRAMHQYVSEEGCAFV